MKRLPQEIESKLSKYLYDVYDLCVTGQYNTANVQKMCKTDRSRANRIVKFSQCERRSGKFNLLDLMAFKIIDHMLSIDYVSWKDCDKIHKSICAVVIGNADIIRQMGDTPDEMAAACIPILRLWTNEENVSPQDMRLIDYIPSFMDRGEWQILYGMRAAKSRNTCKTVYVREIIQEVCDFLNLPKVMGDRRAVRDESIEFGSLSEQEIGLVKQIRKIKYANSANVRIDKGMPLSIQWREENAKQESVKQIFEDDAVHGLYSFRDSVGSKSFSYHKIMKKNLGGQPI